MIPIERLEFCHREGMGRITDGDLLYAPARAWISDPLWGYENGWAPNEWSEEGDWFQARMTRVLVGDPPMPKSSKIAWTVTETPVLHEIKRVHDAYIAHRGFSEHLPIEETWRMREPQAKRFILFYRKGGGPEPIAFTLMRLYADGSRIAMASLQFSWDYADPRLSVGRFSTKVEKFVAAHAGAEHLYVGPGYQKACLYKAMEPGFEWWTGSEWSDSVSDYAALCARDDEVQSIAGLMAI